MTEIIVIEQMREFLLQQLPQFSHPILLITAEYFSGCSKCKSDATVLYVQLQEKATIANLLEIHEIIKHKLPIQVYIVTKNISVIPRKIVIGTQLIEHQYQPVIRKVIN